MPREAGVMREGSEKQGLRVRNDGKEGKINTRSDARDTLNMSPPRDTRSIIVFFMNAAEDGYKGVA
jgi:hypothetical protein